MTKTRYKILYVDDEATNLRIFRASFLHFYDIHTASSAYEGLQILEDQKIDLILTDQRMPEVSGVEFLKMTLPKYQDIPRIIISGFTDLEVIKKAINEGKIHQYISKPWNIDRLKETLDQILETSNLRKANKELLKSLEKANGQLEQKVKERTAQLEEKNLLLEESNEKLQEQSQKISSMLDNVTQLNHELEKKNKNLNSSISYAKRIQDAILPSEEEMKNCFPDSFVFFKPRDIVSGDFYWISQLGNHHMVIAADCTGHGVPGALMSMLGMELVDKILNSNHDLEVHRVLGILNLEIIKMLKQDGKSANDGMDISVCKIYPKERKLEYAGARNPVILIDEETGNVQEVTGDAASIGGGQKVFFNFQKKTINIPTKACLYMFSDGFQDQFGGPENRKFSKKRLYELLLTHSSKSMAEQREALEKTLLQWQHQTSQKQIDDILVMGMRIE